MTSSVCIANAKSSGAGSNALLLSRIPENYEIPTVTISTVSTVTVSTRTDIIEAVTIGTIETIDND